MDGIAVTAENNSRHFRHPHLPNTQKKQSADHLQGNERTSGPSPSVGVQNMNKKRNQLDRKPAI